jgi:membrane complex biogenesis BtpA family protein
MEELYDYAVRESERYAQGGMDGIIVENHGDIPFSRPEEIGQETATAMAVMADRVQRAIGLPVGVNVLANGAMTATAVAKAAGAAFIRVNQWANAYVANEGIIEGPAARVARYRSWLRAEGLKVFADVHVKHGAHAIVADRSIPELTRDVEFFDADVVIATGQRTGDSATRDEIEAIKSATDLPVVVGSGVTLDNVGWILSICDGVIVASSLKREGVWWNEVDPDRVQRFMDRARTGT